MTETLSACPDSKASTPAHGSPQGQEANKPVISDREWGRHPIDLRLSLPLPFGCWYVTLVAGKERRCTERLAAEREKHPLETTPNLMFLFSLGAITSAVLIGLTILTLIHGFGWSFQLTLPA